VPPPWLSATRCMSRHVRPCAPSRPVLKAAGSSLDRVVKVTVLRVRPDLYREMNEAYAEFFPEAKPARAMVRFGADIPGVLVAVEAIALA
jgi:2-iminobutanoate/2-iminopropanoate deaminase